MATPTENDASRVLEVLVRAQMAADAADVDQITDEVPGNEIESRTELSPAQINRAVDLLERSGYVEVERWIGTRPFEFGTVRATPEGRIAFERAQQEAVSQGQGRTAPPAPRVFIVHGHDGGLRDQVARVIERLGLEAVILTEQPNEGRTLIEKFETRALEVGFAVVLLTADDIGYGGDDPQPPAPNRPRQNVILELGYFIGALGRSHIAPMFREGVELPSDIHGLAYLPLDDAGAWRFKLAEELAAAGYEIDFNRLRSW
jgi:predicted nucleotide-binding protein